MPTSAAIDRYRDLVDDWPAFLEASSAPLPTCVWTNLTRTTPAGLEAAFKLEDVPTLPLSWTESAFRLDGIANPGTTLAFIAGLCHIQEEVSMLPVHLLTPQPGDRVLDLCAAPGNKTVQCAIAMRDEGVVVANDRSGIRLNVLRTAQYRLGLLSIHTTVVDAAVFPVPEPRFDRLIVDVPCSCEGTSRKHPNAALRASVEQSRALAATQTAILARAAALCRPGGRIVYSTCTYAPEENELVVDRVVRENPTLRIVSVPIDRFTASPGITSWEGRDLLPEMARTLRIWPHQNDTGGFYIAVLEKSDA